MALENTVEPDGPHVYIIKWKRLVC